MRLFRLTTKTNGCNQSDSVSINVLIEQSSSPQISNNNVQLCESDSITLGGLGTTGNGGILNFFFWDGASIIAVAESELAVTGTYYVTQTGPGNSCESIDSLEINVSVTGLLAPTTNNSSPVFCVIDNLLVGDLDVNGNYPPPPLNGTAHTWHHSPEQLLYTINKGGTEMGGQMPAFEKRLTEEEKKALIDYMYSLWPKEIQVKYDDRFK